MSAVRAEFDAISIHTPLAGSDDTRPDAGMVRVISIHTPLAGSDEAIHPAIWTGT